jgi:TolB-like protein
LVYTVLPKGNNDHYNTEAVPNGSVIEKYPNSTSVAILPFKSLSTNEEDQLLADAVMEQILKHLQRVPISDLSLRPRTSTERYQNSTKSTIQIGNELAVNYILQGSFQKIGDTANVAVQLINVKTDDHVWAEEYSRNWNDIFNVQAEVAKKVADKLSATFSPTAQKAISIEPTNNMFAFTHATREG